MAETTRPIQTEYRLLNGFRVHCPPEIVPFPSPADLAMGREAGEVIDTLLFHHKDTIPLPLHILDINTASGIRLLTTRQHTMFPDPNHLILHGVDPKKDAIATATENLERFSARAWNKPEYKFTVGDIREETTQSALEETDGGFSVILFSPTDGTADEYQTVIPQLEELLAPEIGSTIIVKRPRNPKVHKVVDSLLWDIQTKIGHTNGFSNPALMIDSPYQYMTTSSVSRSDTQLPPHRNRTIRDARIKESGHAHPVRIF